MQKTNVQEKAEYLIGDVARMVGLSRDALRFYEKKGIINARKKDNGLSSVWLRKRRPYACTSRPLPG